MRNVRLHNILGKIRSDLGESMKYGQIAEGKRINEFIYLCFQYLNDSENEKFVREFKQQPHNQIQIMHTFRELVLGAFLSQNRFLVSHNHEIDSKTPDWCILDDHACPQSIIELVNFHPDAETSADIVRQIHERGIWSNFIKPNTKRLYEAIREKIIKYRSLATKHTIPYVVSVFGDFAAVVEQDEIDECLFDSDTGLFKLYPEVSGVLYFEESSGVYFFSYKPNPFASFPMSIPNGRFP
jgi:hypothetical protein